MTFSFYRFTAQYDNSTKIIGKIVNICLLSKSYLTSEDTWRMMRYANAVHLLGYVGLSDVYTDSNTFKPINHIQKLLNSEEIKRLEEIGLDNGGNCFREVICWMLDLLSNRSNEKEDDNATLSSSLVSSQLCIMITDEILQLRGFVTLLFFFEDQPLPFVYLHSLVLSISMFLPICSYAIATNLFPKSILPTVEDSYLYEPLGLFVLCLVIFFFEGLKCISHQLMDPYGDDVHDLSVFHYINSAILSSRRVLSSKKIASSNSTSELTMEKDRPSKGQGYGDSSRTCVVVSATNKVSHL